ncbi:MAG: guanylate kinase [Lachnospiraceae bacterium]|jgi:guanylate kinase
MNGSERGCLFVISGFSGSGKGTAMEWFRNHPERYALSVSCTSRKPRPGEKEGVSYYFISHEEFLKRAEQGFFLEHAIYADHGYGTPRAFVEENLAAGKDVILEIELQGAMQVRKIYPDTTLIFITPPSIDELKRRLTGRGTETAEQIAKRLRRAVLEGQYIDQYDYIVVNDDLQECIRQLDSLMQTQRLKVSHSGELIRSIREGLKKIESEEN